MTDEERMEQEGAGTAPDLAEDEPPAEAPAGAPATEAPPRETPRKRCACCGAIIPLPALSCPQCRSWVALWEGSIAREYFYLLAAALTCLFGTLLPWKPLPETAAPGLASEVVGIHYMSGAVIFLFSAVGALVCLYNIRSKKLLFWPILLLLVENAFTLAVYFMTWELKVAGESYGLLDAIGWAYDQGSRGQGGVQGGLWSVYRTQGIGIYFVLAGTLFILLQIVMSVVKAASRGKPPRPPGPGAGRGRRR